VPLIAASSAVVHSKICRYITRAYGQPQANQHAVQLELAQCNYMDEFEPYPYIEDKAVVLQGVLKPMLEGMISWGAKVYGR